MRDAESAIALAMLPAGAVMMIVSAGAFIAVALLAVATAIVGGDWRLVGWCIGAAIIAARNVRGGIETMSAFAWRPFATAVAWSAAVLASYPGWWV